MTTFKNNAKYGELIYTYLDIAIRGDLPITVEEVLRTFEWRFKGGSLQEASQRTRLKPKASAHRYPDGFAKHIAEQWPGGEQAQALREVLIARKNKNQLRIRGVLSRLATYQMLVSSYGIDGKKPRVYSGMKAIYHIFSLVWEWCPKRVDPEMWILLEEYTQEVMIATSGVSRVHVPTAEQCRLEYWRMLEESRLCGLLRAIRDVKEIIKISGSGQARKLARWAGLEERKLWGENTGQGLIHNVTLGDMGSKTRFIPCRLGPCLLRVSQNVGLLGAGEVRYALGKSDMERLHQLLMSSASAIVGVCSQACVGTAKQKNKARLAVQATERNITRIVQSSKLVPLGDEVLVCKGYRRAYTAHLGVLAGPLCRNETEALVLEAEQTAPRGALDVRGYMADVAELDAASSLNAAKVFKICPAPDVCPGAAMIDRILQIGDGNIVDHASMVEFEEELRTQVLRAYIRSTRGRLKLRDASKRPLWYGDYMQGKYDSVPSSEIHENLIWEGTATVPDVSEYDPSNWKDSGIGADTVREAEAPVKPKIKNNMITRLIFDDECPMPGRQVLSSDHVIKFFIKSEGHKDPARSIFSANLTDRQAQSWMERAVDTVAREHPSYMIGQEVDAREAKVVLLNKRPAHHTHLALYYSFDISGWSAKMPAEPQRISHKIWGDLYGGHLFRKATLINEDAYIYVDIEGHCGWYRNTHSNLEGFNGKEMTMVLVALLSLSVRRWRRKVVERGIMEQRDADTCSALLFAYIDDGLSRIDLPRKYAIEAFTIYKETVIQTFANCGFSVEVSKCFPSDRFSIFLNEVYLAGRHVVHGVRAAMGISAEPTERHTSLTERVTSVSTGVRGAVMAGLSPLSAVFLMCYHVLLHLEEWVDERDPVVLATWSVTPRAWGGLGLPNMMQLFMSGSGSAFEEGVATLQSYARMSVPARKVFIRLVKSPLQHRDPVGILTAPLSGKSIDGYMVDSRVAVAVRRALQRHLERGDLSSYAQRLLRYSDTSAFEAYAEAIIPRDPKEVLQEQMLTNLAEAHPHAVFSGFARRLEKSMTVKTIVGGEAFQDITRANRADARKSIECLRIRMCY